MTKGKTNRNKISLPGNYLEPSDLLFHPNNIMATATLKNIEENFCDKKTNILTDEEDPPVTTERGKKIYFKVVRKMKKRGKRRLKDNSKLHDKFSQYNKICKIGVHFAKTLYQLNHSLFLLLFVGFISKNSDSKNTQFLRQNAICSHFFYSTLT